MVATKYPLKCIIVDKNAVFKSLKRGDDFHHNGQKLNIQKEKQRIKFNTFLHIQKSLMIANNFQQLKKMEPYFPQFALSSLLLTLICSAWYRSSKNWSEGSACAALGLQGKRRLPLLKAFLYLSPPPLSPLLPFLPESVVVGS